MMFRVTVGWVFVLVAGSAFAQAPAEPLRFKWQAGQVLHYSVEQVTTVTETTLDETTNQPVVAGTLTRMSLTKRWEVKAIDPAGIATLELSIAAMKQELTRPGAIDKDGKPTVIKTLLDSATPEGKQQMEAYLNKPVMTVKLDTLGRVVEATAPGGSVERVRAELPFRISLPESLPAGGTWDRSFSIKLNPPLGTGEKHDATQSYTTKPVKDGLAVFGVTTALKNPPKDPAEMPPLVPMLWTGDVYFEPATGRYIGARLTVKTEVANHQGEKTKFAYESQYSESLVAKSQ